MSVKNVGSKSALNKQDLAFVNSWKILAEKSGEGKELKPEDKFPEGLEKISFEEIEDPESTGALTITFWKDKAGNYFILESGGCEAFKEFLYGPFVLKNGKFAIV